MTTTVIISSPKPNHHKVGVQIAYSGDAYTPAQLVLDDGESTIVHVHDAASVLITEVKKSDIT